MGARAVIAATGVSTAVAGSAAWGRWPVALLFTGVAASSLALLAWVLADAARSSRLSDLIKATHATPTIELSSGQTPSLPGRNASDIND